MSLLPPFMPHYDIDRLLAPYVGQNRRASTVTLYDLALPVIEDALCTKEKDRDLEFHLRNVGSGRLGQYFGSLHDPFPNDVICSTITGFLSGIVEAIKVPGGAQVSLLASDAFITFRRRMEPKPGRTKRLGGNGLYGVGVKDSLTMQPGVPFAIVPYSNMEMDAFMDCIRREDIQDLVKPQHVQAYRARIAAILVPPYEPLASQAVRILPLPAVPAGDKSDDERILKRAGASG